MPDFCSRCQWEDGGWITAVNAGTAYINVWRRDKRRRALPPRPPKRTPQAPDPRRSAPPVPEFDRSRGTLSYSMHPRYANVGKQKGPQHSDSTLSNGRQRAASAGPRQGRKLKHGPVQGPAILCAGMHRKPWDARHNVSRSANNQRLHTSERNFFDRPKEKDPPERRPLSSYVPATRQPQKGKQSEVQRIESTLQHKGEQSAVQRIESTLQHIESRIQLQRPVWEDLQGSPQLQSHHPPLPAYLT